MEMGCLRYQGLNVIVDFLIQPSLDAGKGGYLRRIQEDFAAVITPGPRLAFQDKRESFLIGYTAVDSRVGVL